MTPTPAQQLDTFLAALDPGVRKLFQSVRRATRARFKACNEMVYDYGHSLVISYSPTEKGYDGIVSIAARKGEVAFYFLNGPALPDPQGLLRGSGKQARFIVVESAATLKEPAVHALIEAAIARSKVPPPAAGSGTLIIQSTSKSRKPRAAKQGS